VISRFWRRLKKFLIFHKNIDIWLRVWRREKKQEASVGQLSINAQNRVR